MFSEIVAVGTRTGVQIFDLRRGTKIAGHTGVGVCSSQGFALTPTWTATLSDAKPVCHVHMLNRGDTSAKLIFPLPEEITCLHAIDQGRYLVGGATSGRILIWAPASGRLLRSWDAHYGKVTALASNGGVLVTGGEDAAVHVWVLSQVLASDMDTPPMPVATMAEHTMPITSLHTSNLPLLSSRGRVFSASRDHTCKIWRVRVENTDDGKETRIEGRVDLLGTLLYPAAVADICVDIQETRVFAATAVGVFQTNMYQKLDAASSGPTLVALGGHKGTVIVDGHIPYPAVESDVIAVSLSIDGSLLVSAVATGVVRVWDTASRQCLRTLTDKTLAAGVLQLTTQMAPPQLGGPRAGATAGLHRPQVLTDTVMAPKISAISFVSLQRIPQQTHTDAISDTAFDAPVRTKLNDTVEDIKHFERGLSGRWPYSETSREDMGLIGDTRPSSDSAERLVSELVRQNDRLQRHHMRTRRLNDELYQGAVTEWLANRQKTQS